MAHVARGCTGARFLVQSAQVHGPQGKGECRETELQRCRVQWCRAQGAEFRGARCRAAGCTVHTAELHSVGCRGAGCSAVGRMVHSAQCGVRRHREQRWGAQGMYTVHGAQPNSADGHGAQVWAAAV